MRPSRQGGSVPAGALPASAVITGNNQSGVFWTFDGSGMDSWTLYSGTSPSGPWTVRNSYDSNARDTSGDFYTDQWVYIVGVDPDGNPVTGPSNRQAYVEV